MMTLTDRRATPPVDADELGTLTTQLDFYRETLLMKVSELKEEQLVEQHVPSKTTLLGLVKHLANVERWWFRTVFAGEAVRPIWLEKGPDSDFIIEKGEIAAEIIRMYRQEVDRARRIVAKAGSLDERARYPEKADHTLRWILCHMIAETARHCGHADILREQTDGQTGE